MKLLAVAIIVWLLWVAWSIIRTIPYHLGRQTKTFSEAELQAKLRAQRAENEARAVKVPPLRREWEKTPPLHPPPPGVDLRSWRYWQAHYGFHPRRKFDA